MGSLLIRFFSFWSVENRKVVKGKKTIYCCLKIIISMKSTRCCILHFANLVFWIPLTIVRKFLIIYPSEKIKIVYISYIQAVSASFFSITKQYGRNLRNLRRVKVSYQNLGRIPYEKLSEKLLEWLAWQKTL